MNFIFYAEDYCANVSCSTVYSKQSPPYSMGPLDSASLNPYWLRHWTSKRGFMNKRVSFTWILSILRATIASLSSSRCFSVESWSRPIKLTLPRFCTLPLLLCKKFRRERTKNYKVAKYSVLTYIIAKLWLTQNEEFSWSSFEDCTAGSHNNIWRFNLGNAIRD